MKRRLKQHLNIWSVSSVMIAFIMVLAMWQIVKNLFTEATPTWLFIQANVLPDVIQTTLLLIFGVALLSGILGSTMAWLVVMYEFPLKKWFKWTLILPLALPAYIAGYIYANMLSYTGTISRFLRLTLGLSVPSNWFNIMTLEGAILLFSFTLYPYVYMASKSFLEKQPRSLFEAARSLGKSQTTIFFKIFLPLMRPALVGSVLLVIMEVLNDYGLVAYFNIRVFSTAIFSAWFTSGDLLAAVRLAAHLIVLIFFILVIEKLARGKRRYTYASTQIKPIRPIRLSKLKASGVIAYFSAALLIGFFIPVAQLLYWATKTYRLTLNIELFYLSINALSIAFVSTVVILVFAVLVANYSRYNRGPVSQGITRLTTLGYSIPGAVIAIAVIILFTSMDRLFVPVYRFFDPNSITLVLTTSIAMLGFAYVLRFMAIGYNMIDASYEKIGKEFTMASYTLGKGKLETFLKVDFPMIVPGVISAFIIVFIDIMKELPLTLILRPFNYDTLATKVYQYASDEMIQESSVPALMIIVLCTLAIYFITHYKKGGKRYERNDD